jgi:hypothetical protein
MELPQQAGRHWFEDGRSSGPNQQHGETPFVHALILASLRDRRIAPEIDRGGDHHETDQRDDDIERVFQPHRLGDGADRQRRQDRGDAVGDVAQSDRLALVFEAGAVRAFR